MKKVLDEIWYNLDLMTPSEIPEERQYLSQLIHHYSEKMYEGMPEKNRKAFLQYERYENEAGAIAQREAFFRGVHFATSFLLEALCHD